MLKKILFCSFIVLPMHAAQAPVTPQAALNTKKETENKAQSPVAPTSLSTAAQAAAKKLAAKSNAKRPNPFKNNVTFPVIIPRG